jgi:hypothetical protein
MAKLSVFRDYPRTFWVASIMELFERGACYGMNSALAGYLALSIAGGGLGFLYMGVSSKPAQYRTIVQAVIFLALGIWGFWMNRRGSSVQPQVHRDTENS